MIVEVKHRCPACGAEETVKCADDNTDDPKHYRLVMISPTSESREANAVGRFHVCGGCAEKVLAIVRPAGTAVAHKQRRS